MPIYKKAWRYGTDGLDAEIRLVTGIRFVANLNMARQVLMKWHHMNEPELPLLHVILYQPEIPPNTGNIIRLCANTASVLHLVGPLGFVLDNARLRRAGLDYDELTEVKQYLNWQTFLKQNPVLRLWAFSTQGQKNHCEIDFRENDGLLFGPESRGLPKDLLDELGPDRIARIPMQTISRSLNLSNTVAIGLYEALRQLGFTGLR